MKNIVEEIEKYLISHPEIRESLYIVNEANRIIREYEIIRLLMSPVEITISDKTEAM